MNAAIVRIREQIFSHTWENFFPHLKTILTILTMTAMTAKKNSKIIAESFVNRNANVVPLHRKNKAPACGRKNSHVRAQKLTT